MASQPRLQLEIAQFLEGISETSSLAERLLTTDPSFRGLCEDFALAKTTLDTLESFQSAHALPKIAEYRKLVAELGNEITTALEHAKRPQ